MTRSEKFWWHGVSSATWPAFACRGYCLQRVHGLKRKESQIGCSEPDHDFCEAHAMGWLPNTKCPQICCQKRSAGVLHDSRCPVGSAKWVVQSWAVQSLTAQNLCLKPPSAQLHRLSCALKKKHVTIFLPVNYTWQKPETPILVVWGVPERRFGATVSALY